MARYDEKACEVCQELIPPRAKVCRFCGGKNVPNETQGSYNKFGIPRDIPAGIARTVREECGFGCVICGELPTEYEHFDPQFAEEREEHKAAGIALLCLPHHQQRSGKPPAVRSNEIRPFRNNPFCKQANLEPSYPKFFLSPGPRGIKLGSASVSRGTVRVRSNGQNFIWFEEADVADLHCPVLFGMHLEDEEGHTWLEIENNVLLISPSSNFDIQCEGAEVKISCSGKTVLRMQRYEMDSTLPVDAIEVLKNTLPNWEDVSSAFGINEPCKILDILEADTWCGGKHIQISAQQILVNGEIRFEGDVHLHGLNAAASAEIDL